MTYLNPHRVAVERPLLVNYDVPKYYDDVAFSPKTDKSIDIMLLYDIICLIEKRQTRREHVVGGADYHGAVEVK